MKSLAFLKLVLLLPQLSSADNCNNNCGRQVAGTARQSPPFASRSSLCSAFVTANGAEVPQPEPSVEARGFRWNAYFRRQDTPEPVITGTKPAYATSCPDVTAYWSACQCIDGITATSVASASPTSEDSITITPEPSTSSPSSVTETSSTSSSSATPLPVCTPGLEFAIYTIEPDSDLCESVLASDRSQSLNLKELLEGRIPVATGLTNGSGTVSLYRNGEEASDPIEYNGVQGPPGSTFECNIVEHRGYIEFTAPGQYSILSDVPDDVILVWVGGNAVSGAFSASNSNVWGRCCAWTESLLYSFSLPEFDGPRYYLPYRIFYANSVGPGGFIVKVVNDNGVPGEIDPPVVANCTGEGDPAPGWLPWENEVILP